MRIAFAIFILIYFIIPVYSQDMDLDILDQTLSKDNLDAELDDLEKTSSAPSTTAAPAAKADSGVTESTDFDKLDMLDNEVKTTAKAKPKKDFVEEPIIKHKPVNADNIEKELADEVDDEASDDESMDQADMEASVDTKYENRIAKFYRGKKRMQDKEWQERIGKTFEEVYVVASGDTLWGISEKFMDSPWYWPKIWELNSYITNPHKIEPGQEIRFKFSAEEGPSITLIPGRINDEIKEEKIVDYSVLEQDAVESAFDKSGFLKEGLKTLNVSMSSGSSIGGGEFYLENPPQLLGEVYGGKDNRSHFIAGDEIELKTYIPCDSGKILSVMNKVKKSIFSVNGTVTLLSETGNKMCKARVEKVFAPLQRDMKLIEQLSVPYMESRTEDRVVTGRIVDLSPTNGSVERNNAGEGDRVFIRFNDNEAPMSGTMIYFYEIKDPVTGNDIDPFVTGVAKLVYTSGRYATADVVAASKSLNTETAVTTRF